VLSHPLLPKLRQLKLSGILDTLETRAAQATRDQLSPTEFLAILLDDELERRDQAKLARRVTASGVDPTKTLAGFDFSAVPGVNRTLVADLATGTFVARAQNVILAGPTGVGKSHLMNALVVEALKRDYTALQRPAYRILLDLQAARGDGSYRRRFRQLCTVDLLALDDFGLRPLTPEMAEDFYELVRERYERKALLLTSNRALDEWPEAFGNPLLASAALDRLTHHCHMLIIRGQSYRQRGRRKEDLTDHTVTSEPPEDGAALDPWPTPR
jgi:DNA replication protein DnaC